MDSNISLEGLRGSFLPVFPPLFLLNSYLPKELFSYFVQIKGLRILFPNSGLCPCDDLEHICCICSRFPEILCFSDLFWPTNCKIESWWFPIYSCSTLFLFHLRHLLNQLIPQWSSWNFDFGVESLVPKFWSPGWEEDPAAPALINPLLLLVLREIPSPYNSKRPRSLFTVGWVRTTPLLCLFSTSFQLA